MRVDVVISSSRSASRNISTGDDRKWPISDGRDSTQSGRLSSEKPAIQERKLARIPAADWSN
jgi:hypothetical protein